LGCQFDDVFETFNLALRVALFQPGIETGVAVAGIGAGIIERAVDTDRGGGSQVFA